MIIASLFIFAYVVFCVRSSRCAILCSMFLLLPIHGTIKQLVFLNGGGVFAIWKEIAIIIFFLKSIKKTNNDVRKIFVVYFVLVCYSFLFLWVGLDSGFSVDARVKELFVPCVLTIGLAKSDFCPAEIKKILVFMIIGSLIINFTGILDFSSKSIRMAFRHIMGASYKIASDGTIYYDNSSHAIMGLDRTSGLMAGGPNQLGVYNSFISVMCLSCLFFFKNLLNKKREIRFVYIGLFCSLFCLLVSFSRAGWMIFLITIFYVGLFKAKYRSSVIKIVIAGLVLILMAVSMIPEVGVVLDGTFSGKEASSAARGQMTIKALSFLFDHPWGFGLGASSLASKARVFFAESAMINIGVDIGVVGMGLLVFLLLIIYWRNKKAVCRNDFAIACAGFTIAYLIVSFVSINPYETPFVYCAWFFMGFGLLKIDNQNFST